MLRHFTLTEIIPSFSPDEGKVYLRVFVFFFLEEFFGPLNKVNVISPTEAPIRSKKDEF
jgi:hypothetical protein